MTKNTILEHMDEQAMLQEVLRLEREFEDLKVASQVPSTYETGLSTVSFSIGAPVSNISKYHSVKATLTNADSDKPLFAYPQFSVFLQDINNPDLLTLFPFYEHDIGFGNWGNSTYKKYEHILDVNQWYSWGRTNNSNLVAMLHLRRDDYGAIGIAEADNNRDGVTNAALNLEVYLQWRYLKPGTQS